MRMYKGRMRMRTRMYKGGGWGSIKEGWGWGCIKERWQWGWGWTKDVWRKDEDEDVQRMRRRMHGGKMRIRMYKGWEEGCIKKGWGWGWRFTKWRRRGKEFRSVKGESRVTPPKTIQRLGRWPRNHCTITSWHMWWRITKDTILGKTLYLTIIATFPVIS